MTDFDISLRLRLQNQLSRPAEEAERDLKDLQRAAEQLGRTKGGAGLAGDLEKIGKSATDAHKKLGTVGKEADELRQALGRADNGAFSQLDGKAADARAAISSVKLEADELKAAIGRVDNGALDGLKADANEAARAIRGIGDAAEQQRARLGGLSSPHTQMPPGGPLRHNPAPAGGRLTGIAEGAIDQFGVPIALAAGGMYLVGSAAGGAGLVAGAAIKGAAADEYRSDQMRDTGEYSAEDQARYDHLLNRIGGARHGIGTAKAQETFSALISNGMNNEDAASVADTVVKVGKATEADPVDIANTTVRLQSIMGVKPEQMPAAYDALALGAKFGNFEMKDMAAHGPSMFAAMAAQGSTGLPAVWLTSAMSQSIAARSGSSDQAKTSFEAMLTDMVSPDVADRLKETYGKDIYQIRKDAIAAGRDPTLESLRTYHDAVGGDEKKTRGLFRNSEAYKGYAAVFGDLDLIIERMEKMKNAGGTIDAAYEVRTDNLNSQLARLAAGVANSVKEMAAPVLPFLTQAARFAADHMDKADEQRPKKDEEFRNELSSLRDKFRYDPKADEERRREAAAAAPENARRWRSFLFGAAADPDFDARKHLGITLRPTAGDLDPLKPRDVSGDLGISTGKIPVPAPRPVRPGEAVEGVGIREQLGVDLRPAAKSSIEGYADAISAAAPNVLRHAQSLADQLKAIFNFEVSPTIVPRMLAPTEPAAGSPAQNQRSSLNQSSNIRVTQNISSPNPQHAAIRTRRAQERAIRQAMSRSFHDTGRLA